MFHPPHPMPVLALLVVLGALAAPGAHALEPPMEHEEDWADAPRSVTVTLDAAGYTVERLDPQGERLTFQYAVGNGSIGLAAPGSPPLWLHPASLVAYDDLDEDGRISLGDPILRRVDLAAATGLRPTHTEPEPGRHLLVAQRSLPDGGRITWSALLAEVAINDPDLATASVNLDLRIERFAAPEAGNRTRLALELRVDGRPELLERALVQQGTDAATYLAWSGLAGTGGRSEAVHDTRVAYDGEDAAGAQAVVWISYPAAEVVRHDLQMGAVRPVGAGPLEVIRDEVQGNWPTLLAGGALATVLLLVARLRRSA
ncbi:MAG: hypothetical protein ACPGQL_00390 [Thermoplasmatota archaeon]